MDLDEHLVRARVGHRNILEFPGGMRGCSDGSVYGDTSFSVRRTALYREGRASQCHSHAVAWALVDLSVKNSDEVNFNEPVRVPREAFALTRPAPKHSEVFPTSPSALV
jgi:hypothetical protein